MKRFSKNIPFINKKNSSDKICKYFELSWQCLGDKDSLENIIIIIIICIYYLKTNSFPKHLKTFLRSSHFLSFVDRVKKSINNISIINIIL